MPRAAQSTPEAIAAQQTAWRQLWRLLLAEPPDHPDNEKATVAGFPGRGDDGQEMGANALSGGATKHESTAACTSAGRAA